MHVVIGKDQRPQLDKGEHAQTRPGAQAFLAELVPREAIAGAVGLASSAQAMGRLGGPALAALLYAWGGAGSVFAVDAASFAAVLGAAESINALSSGGSQRITSRLTETRRGRLLQLNELAH